jgi:predicted DNA-binding transcriptional regulator
LLFLYDPYIADIINLGAAKDVQYWLIATPVTIAFIAILAIGAWIGYTMATTPPPKPIEEITAETETETT